MAFKHYKQISKQDIPSMKVENVEAYLRDFSISDDKLQHSLLSLKECLACLFVYSV